MTLEEAIIEARGLVGDFDRQTDGDGVELMVESETATAIKLLIRLALEMQESRKILKAKFPEIHE